MPVRSPTGDYRSHSSGAYYANGAFKLADNRLPPDRVQFERRGIALHCNSLFCRTQESARDGELRVRVPGALIVLRCHICGR